MTIGVLRNAACVLALLVTWPSAASAQAFEHEFTWLGQSLTVPDACFDEEWRFIRMTPQNSERCWALPSGAVAAFNAALVDDDFENDPMAVGFGPDTTGAIGPFAELR